MKIAENIVKCSRIIRVDFEVLKKLLFRMFVLGRALV